MAQHLFPAACLPQAPVPVTVIWTHPDYDATCQHVLVARDWQSRGEPYVRAQADLDPDTCVVAVLPGWHTSALGCSVNV